MFQNITGQVEPEDEYNEEIESNKIKIFLKEAFTKQKILIYIISFMLSTIEGVNGIAPFAISIFAAVLSNKVPALIVYILTLVGTFIGLGSGQALTYLLISLIFIAMMLTIRPKESIEYENEKLRLGKYVVISTLIVKISSLMLSGFIVYDLLATMMNAISVYIFYKIFANSLIVLREFGIKKAFSIEEVIGASVVLAICVSSFRTFSIFGFEIRTILSILIVLVLGWKNGVLVGSTTGVTIGTILGLINGTEPIMIASYALSGMLAGIFSNFGKVGVIVGFILGNGILTYVTNGNTGSIIYLKEILIASLGLLLVPKSISIDVEELFGKAKLLQAGPASRIEDNRETVYRLNNVSETISEIADTYKEVAATIIEDEDIEKEENMKLFINELENNLDGLEENILYDDIEDIEEEIAKDIFEILLNNKQITRKELLEIFANHNNYIVGFDDAQISIKLEEDIKQIIEIINESYKRSKLNFIYKQKIDENKRNIGTQLDGVSKVISSLANNIEEKIEQDSKFEFIIEKEEILQIAKEKNIEIQDINIRKEKTGRFIISVYIDSCSANNEKRGCTKEQMERILSKVLGEKIVLSKSVCGKEQGMNMCVNTYSSQDKYMVQIGMLKKTKTGSTMSGDSSITLKLDDGKYLLAISDGMGTGPKAKQASSIATKMLQRLLSSGFDKDTSIELINSTLTSINNEEDCFATLDIAILDLYAGNIEFIKNGACPTYIKQGKKAQIVKALSLPAGILENISLVVYDKDIEDNDILVMCSDGIMESNEEYQNKELWVKDILEEIETDNTQKIADIITKEAIDNGYGIVKDDMTIITAKFIKK